MKLSLRIFSIIALFVASLVAAPDADAQKRADNKCTKVAREMQEFKLKFLAQEMELRDDQQKQFFDLYNSMTEEKFKVFSEVRALEKRISDKADATEAEYDAVSDAIVKAKAHDAEIEKKYDERFSTFLSKKQIFKMKGAEEKFRHKMREMRKNKKNKGGR